MAEEIDLTPQVVDVKVSSGDPWSIPFTLTGVDLTGATIAAQVRTSKTASAFTELDIAVTDLSEGKFSFGQAVPLAGVYDIQITPLGGLPRTYIGGKIKVVQDVTRP